MFGMKRTIAVMATIAAALALFMCTIYGCGANGSSGGESAVKQEPQYRITKVTVNGQMDSGPSSRIPVIDYLYQDGDGKLQLDAMEWSSVFYERGDMITSNDNRAVLGHKDRRLRSCEWNLEYDASGNLVSKAWSDYFGESGEYKYAYDGNGNETSMQYFKNIPEETLIDEITKEYAGDVIEREDINVYITPRMHRASVDYESEDIHLTNTYDDHGNVVETGGVINGFTMETVAHKYEYDDRGNILVDKVKLLGAAEEQTTTYTYDPNDKLLSRYTVPGDTPKEEVDFTKKDEHEWTRTADGKPLTLRSHRAGGSWTETNWEYDDNGRLLTSTYVDGSTIHVYDTSGNETNTVEPGKTETKYSYDDSGREIEMKATTDKGIVTESRTTEYSSDGTATMQLVKRNSDGNTLIECTCTFDANGCPTALTAKAPSENQSIEIILEYERV